MSLAPSILTPGSRSVPCAPGRHRQRRRVALARVVADDAPLCCSMNPERADAGPQGSVVRVVLETHLRRCGLAVAGNPRAAQDLGRPHAAIATIMSGGTP